MRKDEKYKTIISVLLIVIILQWIFIIATRPKKPRRPAPIPKPPAPLVVKIKGNIAIVLDDWGYNLNNLAMLEEIKYPLTLSVLPNLPYSTEVAQEAHKLGLEVILHLPMEPYEKLRLEKNTVLTGMDETKIQNILKTDLGDIPYVRGVSNHMGSRATGDPKVMGVLFRELKKRDLYFLDSFVSAKTIGARLAKDIGLYFIKRDIFIDNNQEYGYIEGQLNKLKKIAGSYGRAVGIGHDRKVTLQVLGDLMPEIEKEGYRFVLVSDLIKR